MFLREVTLGSAAREYLDRILADGKSLSRALLGFGAHQDWRVYTFLPNAVAEPNTQDDFDRPIFPPLASEQLEVPSGSGVVYQSSRVPDLNDTLAANIASKLGARGAAFLVEDTNARPDDARVRRSTVNRVLHKMEVYWLVRGSEADAKGVLTAWKAASAWRVVGFVVRGQSVAGLNPSTLLDESQIRVIAREIDTIVTAAFDGEGFLIVERDRS